MVALARCEAGAKGQLTATCSERELAFLRFHRDGA